MSQDDADKVLTELMSILVPVVVALAIAVYGALQAKFQQKMLVTAQAMPQGVTTKEVIAAVKSGAAPSLTTQRDEVPKSVSRKAGQPDE